MVQQGYRKDVLLEDERGSGFPAVVRFGPYLFLSQSEGQRRLDTETIDPTLAGKPEAQIRNSYGRVQRRLEQCGFAADCVVWLEHFVSSQEWLLLRLGLWREYFGVERSTGGGAQARQPGINMVTTVALAVVPEEPRVAVTPSPPGPNSGMWAELQRWAETAYRPTFSLDGVRPAKAVQAGPLIFLVGARGQFNPATGERAPEEVPEAFAAQLRNSLDEFALYLRPAQVGVENLVRVDAHIRNVNRAAEFRGVCAQYLGGSVPFTGYAVGMPVGGRGEMDVSAIAAAPGVVTQVARSGDAPSAPRAVRAGPLLFVGACSGVRDTAGVERLADLYGDRAGQVRQALRRLEAVLNQLGAELSGVLRLDVFLRDVYFEDEFVRLAREVFGRQLPTLGITGADLEEGAEVEVAAIAGVAHP